MSVAPALRSRRGPIPARTLPLLPGEEPHSECRLDDAPLAVLDCETTGLEPGAHRIVTLAVVHAEDRESLRQQPGAMARTARTVDRVRLRSRYGDRLPLPGWTGYTD